jgi:hypothetical protein
MSTAPSDDVLESQNEIHGASALEAYENNRLTAPDDVQGTQETPTSDASGRQALERGMGRGRGRPTSRCGRGRRGGRGGHTVSRVGGGRHDELSEGWRIRTPKVQGVVLEEKFSRSVIAERARLFCTSAMIQLKVERLAHELPATRSGHIVLFINDVLDQCRKLLNGHIVLHALGVHPGKVSELHPRRLITWFYVP